jgi:hypothetical protein
MVYAGTLTSDCDPSNAKNKQNLRQSRVDVYVIVDYSNDISFSDLPLNKTGLPTSQAHSTKVSETFCSRIAIKTDIAFGT